MKLITDEKNVQALFVLVTGNLTGVKFGVEITKDEKKKSVFGTFPVFDLDKGNVLFEPVSMCKFLSLKQKKMNLIPNDTEGILVEEFLEKFGKFESALTEDDFKSFDKTLENDFLVGEKLSLADIKNLKIIQTFQNGFPN
eukprot:gene4303-7659_t